MHKLVLQTMAFHIDIPLVLENISSLVFLQVILSTSCGPGDFTTVLFLSKLSSHQLCSALLLLRLIFWQDQPFGKLFIRNFLLF